MKQNTSNLGVGLLLIAGLVLVAFIPIPTCATEVWSDDFTHPSLNDWTITMGEYIVMDGRLTCTEISDDHELGVIYHPSTVTNGTWSFDYVLESGGMYVVLMTDDATGRLRGWKTLLFINPYRIQVCIHQSGTTWPPSPLSEWEFDGTFNCLTEIDVTIDLDWKLQLFVNGTHRLSQSLFTTSRTLEYFGIGCEFGVGNSIDNVVVSDSIDVECTNESCELDHFDETTDTMPTTTTNDTTTTDIAPIPIEMIALGGGAVIIIVLVLVVFMKKKV